MITQDYINVLENLLLIQKAVNDVSEGVTIADCSQEDMPLIFINDAFEKLTGYSKEEALGKNCRFLQGNDTDQPELGKLRKAIKNNESITVILRNYNKDGELFYNELTISPIKDKYGNTTHFIGIQNNVTERIINEEAVKSLTQEMQSKNEQLEKLNQDLQELQYTAVHDIKNPLTAIMTTLELMQFKNQKDSISKDELDKRLNNLVSTSKRMLSIITNFLEAQRVETENVKIIGEIIDINKKIDTLLYHYENLITMKSIKINLDLSPAFSNVITDRNAMISILDNLISNAIKYSPHGKEVIVRTYKESNNYFIEVEDQGDGIKPEQVDKLFRKFEKLDSNYRDRASSTGLGLFIAQKFAQKIQGEITYNGEYGKGAKFVLKFTELSIS